MNMIERVARAISKEHQINGDPDAICGTGEYAHPYWMQFEDHARAAIEAMMKYDDRMFNAGYAVDIMALRSAGSIYEAMIRAALEEK